jgi:hypothetical protein
MYKIIFSFLITTLFSVAHAQVGATTDALGGAGIAAVQPIESAYLNPASLAQLKRYYVDAQYYRQNSAGSDNLNQFSLTITDSSGGSIPGAVILRQRSYTTGGVEIREQLYHLGAAVPLTKTFSLGFSGYLQHTNVPTTGAYNQTNLDASAFWAVTERFSVGFISRGLLGSKKVAFAQSQLKPSSGLGFQYAVLDILRVRADVTYNYEDNAHHRFTHNVGTEFLLHNDFTLRAGYKADDYRGESYYSAGLGWYGPRLKLAYAYQNETRRDIGSRHTIDIWIDL